VKIFYTIQGEGFHQGKAAWFLRLAGCDVGCVWCDVKESWDKNAYKEVSIDEIVDTINSEKTDLVVITGGEPLMYDLGDLTKTLKEQHKALHLETSGAYPISGKWDWITFSPKKFKAPKEEFYQISDELKVVIFNRTDFKFAEDHAQQMHAGCKLYLQPEWSKEKEMIPLIVDYIKENPKWNISLQLHKYLNVP